MDKFDNFMVTMGCIKLDILEPAPAKRSSQEKMGSPSNWESAHRSIVSTYRYSFQGKEKDDELKGSGKTFLTRKNGFPK